MADVQGVTGGGSTTLAADAPTPEESAEMEAAFAEAIGTAVMFTGMQSINNFKEQVSEQEREQEE